MIKFTILFYHTLYGTNVTFVTFLIKIYKILKKYLTITLKRGMI